MEVLKGLRPERVFYFFEKICAIPHGSGNTKQISDFCVEFAKQNGLTYYQDDLNNVIIKKPASAGCENRPTVIIQGHLDMVCEKDADTQFDFLNDGLKLKVQGDMLSATGTTLGGDDGIAVAMGLALLEDKTLKHPKVEVLLTVDEETGLYGAEGLDASNLSGKMLINIDSESEGILTVSCAGGARVDIALALEKIANESPAYTVEISGLLGGHSGAEIHKGRHNANKLMGAFLNTLVDFKLINISGGSKDNVIPSFCTATIVSSDDLTAKAEDFVKQNTNVNDPDLKITVTSLKETTPFVYSAKSSKNAAEIICTLPNGITAMSREIEGLVQTSLNLGVMGIDKDALLVSFAVRSSVGIEKEELVDKLFTIAKEFGASANSHSHYPAWEYKKDSPLRAVMENTYLEMYGTPIKVEAIHAGLECGLFCEKIEGLDAVSFGPNMYDIHSSKERISISSVERCYNYLLRVLENI